MKKFSGNQFSLHYAFCVDGPNYCKPAMKGGHTHNHFYSVCSRHLRRSKDRRKRLFKELLDKNTCIDVFNKGVQNPKCRESFVRAILIRRN